MTRYIVDYHVEKRKIVAALKGVKIFIATAETLANELIEEDEQTLE